MQKNWAQCRCVGHLWLMCYFTYVTLPAVTNSHHRLSFLVENWAASSLLPVDSLCSHDRSLFPGFQTPISGLRCSSPHFTWVTPSPSPFRNPCEGNAWVIILIHHEDMIKPNPLPSFFLLPNVFNVCSFSDIFCM